LKKYAEEVIISYDADTAGQTATMRGLDLLNQIGCNVKVLVIPDGKDPDDFVRKNGPDEFINLVNNSISLLEYKVKILKSKTDTETTDGKIKFLNKVAELLSKIDNSMEREMYIKTLAKQYSITEDAIYSEIYKRLRPKTNFKTAMTEKAETITSETTGKEVSQEKETIHNERMLISLICIDNSIYKKIKDRIKIEDFIDENDRKTAEIVFDRIDSNRGIVPAELLGLLDDKEAGEYAKIIQEECNCESNYKAAMDIIKGMVVYIMDKRKNEILLILSGEVELKNTEAEKLTEELNSLIIKRKNI
jgi:DNA primase